MKKLLASVLLVGIIVLLVQSVIRSSTPSQHTFVRKEIHAVSAQADVRALNIALDSMRKLPCTNPLSWYYQGAVHWIPDTIKVNPLCPSYTTVANLYPAWDNCTHTTEGHEKLHFLAWHRLYIWHFEKIVRKLSGYQEFALPYWGYTNNQLTLQKLFRDTTSALYESARFDSLNAGYPLSGEILRALDTTKLFSYTTFEQFSNHINAAPHGAMHDYIGHGNTDPDTTQKTVWNKILNTYGSDGLMGWVPTAGFDPVFWTHHSEIDRLWQQWSNSPNGRAITLEILTSHPWSYTFFDENGNKVQYTPEQVLDILYTMDYKFDDVDMRKPVKENAPLLKATNQPLIQYTPKTPIKINGQITDAVTVGKTAVQNSGQTVTLTVETSFDSRPRGVYEVYVNHVGDNYSTHDSSFAGFMTFFESQRKRSERFDFTIPRDGTYKVTIYKHNGKPNGNLNIKQITIK